MSWINVTYRICAPRDELDTLARALALEQSVEVSAEVVTDPFVAENIMGRVAADDGPHEVVIRLATATTGFDVAQTVNMLFGNSSLHAHVELVDVECQPEFLARFCGPRHGIDGIRRRLQATRRPLTCAARRREILGAAGEGIRRDGRLSVSE